MSQKLPRITTKEMMYKLLAAGELGNTIPQYFSTNEWSVVADKKISRWGIRSLIPGDPRSRLNVLTENVTAYIGQQWKGNYGYNISPMVDDYAILRAQCVDSSHGFYLEYVDMALNSQDLSKLNHPWRYGFEHHRKELTGVMAWELLRALMGPCDYEYLRLLLDDYPEHAVEFSVCSRELGLWKHYNTVIWEVRAY